LTNPKLTTKTRTVNAPITINSLTTNATFAAEARAEYASTRRGPLSSPTGDFLLFLPVQTYTNTTTALSALAVAQNASVSLPLSAPPEVRKGYTATHASLAAKIAAPDAAFLEIIWADGAVVLGLQHPFSRGAVAARSASMFDAPAADAGFLRNPLDVALLREGVRFARRFVRADGLAELAAAEVMPGGDVVSDAGLEEWIRGAASTLYHPAGSCRMGRREEGGVVDKELRVYGVQGLRVVDASVMPVLPASHTMTTVYAVAERAADIIKRGAVGS
jgi:choline dehydrogenase-like flavoprotein